MSEDPIEAIEQVIDRIQEGVAFGNESVNAGWLHNASKEVIIEWLSVNIMRRLVNALERTKEALSATSEKWSEHDETYLKSALWHLCNSISNGKSQDFRSDLGEWIKGLKRRINAGEMKRNCDRFNTGDVEKDAQDALEAYLNSGVCGYRALQDGSCRQLKGKAIGIDFTTEIERKRCKQIDKVDDLVYKIRCAIGCGIDTIRVTNALKKLRDYLNREFPLKPAEDPEKEMMLDAIIRINNWCCLVLAENAFTSDTSGNYLKALSGICSICQPFVKQRIEETENENG